jgi:hypothetical protein
MADIISASLAGKTPTERSLINIEIIFQTLEVTT